MQEFDPRQPAVRLAPRAVVVLAGCTAVVLAWQIASRHQSAPAAGDLDPSALSKIERQAFAQAETQPGFAQPISIAIKVAPGETFESAVRRAGVGQQEAQQAVRALGQAFDTVNIKAGLAFEAAIARPQGAGGPARLLGLSLRTGPASAVTLARAFDGVLHLRQLNEKVSAQTYVAQGALNGSLYESAEKAGATPELTAQVVKLFAHKLDFSRDIHPGDKFSMVFDRQVTESGRTVQTGDLLYAEIQAKAGASRFYRFKAPGATQADYFDEMGKNIRGFLLRTPLDSARITSSFGMRFHPILGFTRMHTGIDFGAPVGTPVFAAGDGVVEKAQWAGGYGRWLQIRHNAQYETGYGHLSGWAVKPGQHVHQGQVVAYVGSTGLSTGPHLHYEIIIGGKKVNPADVKTPASAVLGGKELAAFKVEKARIDALVSEPAKGLALTQTPPGDAPHLLR
ncbi:MAG TPA: peptidoglycan DD-metalloendopeptidase family protein [Caulobacteraceae bacterium]|nr:peptidoglycan DD-metalloendopeptidase family protein [Caulobacteraceae bacterium]